MSFDTTYPDAYILIAENPANIVFGTLALGDSFGKVNSASVKRASDKVEIKKANTQGILAVILHNPRFELTMKTQFTADVEAPGTGDPIDFPLAGVTGRVLEANIDWEEAGQRGLSITATSWDTLGSGGAGELTVVTPA